MIAGPAEPPLSIARDRPPPPRAGKVDESGRAPGARERTRFPVTGCCFPDLGSVMDAAPPARELQPLRPLENWGPPVQPKAPLLRTDLWASSLGKAAIVPSLEPEASVNFPDHP